MSASPNRLYRLERKDISRGAKVLANAFYHDPFFRAVFPRASKRLSTMVSFFKVMLSLHLSAGQVYAISEQLEGIAVWSSSQKAISILGSVIRSGGLALSFEVNLKALFHMLSLVNHIQQREHKLFPPSFVGLEFLGVDPAHQRKGYARQLLEAVLKYSDSRGLPCCLMTNTDINVKIYQKFGFKLLKSEFFRGVRHFYMIRTPQGVTGR